MGTICIKSAYLRGIEARLVQVEISLTSGIPGMTIVGMPDAAVLEARARIRCALRNSAYKLPRSHVTVSLYPASERKSGSCFDLAIALGLLMLTDQLEFSSFSDFLCIGELTLDGAVRSVRGEAAYAKLAHSQGLKLLCGDSAELQAKRSCDYILSNLRSLDSPLKAFVKPSSERQKIGSIASQNDYADVSGQEFAKRALTIAAAGQHGLIMVGPPGSGKTMLARRLPSILPTPDKRFQEESELIYSVSGLKSEQYLSGQRPFRAPHHSVSTAGMVGGGRPVLPGEISLAHGGVLFLDELPEFSSHTLQALRQPIEDGYVNLVRADGAYRFPSRFQLIAAANPCPCGYLGDSQHSCKCPPATVERYQRKIGGPLLDRFEMFITVNRPKVRSVIEQESGASSQDMKVIVEDAREFKAHRTHKRGFELDFKNSLSRDAAKKLEEISANLGLSARSIVNLMRIARTIADIAHHQKIETQDLLESNMYRKVWG